MKKLYLFDFDGTLTTEDTMFLFLKFFDSKRYRRMYAKHVPLFAMLKLKLVEAENVKKSFIASVLKNQTKERIETAAEAFFQKYYPGIIRENALEFINHIDRNKTECYLVTASMDIWVKPFAEKFNMKLISTRAEFVDGVFTGSFIGKNCNGEEKLHRIKEALGTKKFDKKVAFGDSAGDKQMLSYADESFFRFFH